MKIKFKDILSSHDTYQLNKDKIEQYQHGKLMNIIPLSDIKKWSILEEEMIFDIVKIEFNNSDEIILLDYKNDLLEILRNNPYQDETKKV